MYLLLICVYIRKFLDHKPELRTDCYLNLLLWLIPHPSKNFIKSPSKVFEKCTG